jgi:hypothetical protein
MPNRFDKFVHDENLRLLDQKMRTETDPVRLAVLQGLLKEERERVLSPVATTPLT